MAGIQQYLSQNFGHAGTLALVFCSIYGAFVAFDNNLSPHAKEYYAKLLKSRKYENFILSLPYGLTTIFKGFLVIAMCRGNALSDQYLYHTSQSQYNFYLPLYNILDDFSYLLTFH
jgi:hypothetical protein